ncbi:hypothetical protein M405DRAFT_936815 [Rhizopogon salebrosus TDB-379]|nr:hypothetical protein M405DRAFT_936815 [Rhizopogon salebrosus TDB-379]
MEGRMALSEAEAELADLNIYSMIDAVVIDGIDALVPGALQVIKNSSLTLSGINLLWTRKANLVNTMLWCTQRKLVLNRGGFVLCDACERGLRASGDVGKGIAHGLTRCGFGDELPEILYRRSTEDTRPALARWRSNLNLELYSNFQEQLQHPYPSRSLLTSKICRYSRTTPTQRAAPGKEV